MLQAFLYILGAIVLAYITVNHFDLQVFLSRAKRMGKRPRVRFTLLHGKQLASLLVSQRQNLFSGGVICENKTFCSLVTSLGGICRCIGTSGLSPYQGDNTACVVTGATVWQRLKVAHEKYVTYKVLGIGGVIVVPLFGEYLTAPHSPFDNCAVGAI